MTGNNNNNNNTTESNGISWAPVSFGDENAEVFKSSGGATNFRGNAPTMLANNAPISGMGFPAALHQPVTFSKTQTQQPVMSMNSDQFAPISGLNSYVNTAPLKTMPAVLPAKNLEVVSDFFVPSKIQLPGKLRDTPTMFNELNSFLVSESAPEVLASITDMLTKLPSDVQFSVDEQNFIVIGTTFVDDVTVSFKVCVFAEMDGTRCELRRTSGSSVAFSTFYQAVEQAMGQALTFSNGYESDLAFPPLPSSMSLDSLGSLGDLPEFEPMGYAIEDLQRFAQDLSEDCYQVETLSMILDLEKDVILSCEELVGEIRVCVDSSDVAVQRLALKILIKIDAKGVELQQQPTQMVAKYLQQINR